MTAIDPGLQELKRRHPEWDPWLAVVQEILRETASHNWDTPIPVRVEPQPAKAPLLAGATLALEPGQARGLLDQLIRTAAQGGTKKMVTLGPVLRARIDSLALFKASLCQDGNYLTETAMALGADPEAFQAVGVLLAVPFLQACNRLWTPAIPESWIEGYCPVCGAWPALAEVRGIERSRYFRCGRCGGEWQARCLLCCYCGMDDHKELVSLVPEKSGTGRVVDACKRCLGYVKVFTTLQGSQPAKIVLDDLASVDLDVAAFEQGYRRPTSPGYALSVTITTGR